METAQQFIKAISNITWSQFERNAESNGTLKSDDGFSLSYGTKFHERGSLPRDDRSSFGTTKLDLAN